MKRKIIISAILVILVLLVIGSANNFFKVKRIEYYNEKEKLMINASKEYFSFYNNYLPKEINKKTRVLLSALVLEQYMDKIKDDTGKDCDISKSYVEVEKTREDEFLYKAHLVCDNYKTKDGE